MNIDKMKNDWLKFKKARNRNVMINQSRKLFITVLEREKMIDDLYSYIHKLEND